MKKVFAILLVLSVVAGCVFAIDTESHQLAVQTIIKEQLPAFQLRFTGKEVTAVSGKTNEYTIGNTDITVATNDTSTTQGATFANDPNAATTPTYTDSTKLYVGFDLGIATTHTAAFHAFLVKNTDGYAARTNKQFTLTFSDGTFTGLKANGSTHADISPDSIVTTATTSNLTSGGTVAPSSDKKALVVTFNGASAPNSAVDLGYATYTWTGDATLDMGAYTANIKMTITQE